jgi:hypothetical protein
MNAPEEGGSKIYAPQNLGVLMGVLFLQRKRQNILDLKKIIAGVGKKGDRTMQPK